jgi:hypothetical protein
MAIEAGQVALRRDNKPCFAVGEIQNSHSPRGVGQVADQYGFDQGGDWPQVRNRGSVSDLESA